MPSLDLLDQLKYLAVWGLLATGFMTTVLEGAHLAGFTRLSLPFLFGTFVTGRRRSAVIWGYILYLLGGWLFAVLYVLVFASLGSAWWIGLITGLAHGLFLVTVFLPLLPYVHPRIATDYDGPSALRRLQPPGLFGINYGISTPVVTVLAQSMFGLIMAIGHPD